MLLSFGQSVHIGKWNDLQGNEVVGFACDPSGPNGSQCFIDLQW
jgi:hypothetical protein